MMRLMSKGFATCARMMLKTTVRKILGCTLHTVNKDNSHIPVCLAMRWGGRGCCVHRGTCPESLCQRSSRRIAAWRVLQGGSTARRAGGAVGSLSPRSLLDVLTLRPFSPAEATGGYAGSCCRLGFAEPSFCISFSLPSALHSYCQVMCLGAVALPPKSLSRTCLLSNQGHKDSR